MVDLPDDAPDARVVALGAHDARVVDSEALDSLDAPAASVVGTWALQDPSLHGLVYSM